MKNKIRPVTSGLNLKVASIDMNLLHWDSKRPKKYQITTGLIPKVRCYSHCHNGVKKSSITTPSQTPLRQWGNKNKNNLGQYFDMENQNFCIIFLYWKFLLTKQKDRYLIFSSLPFFRLETVLLNKSRKKWLPLLKPAEDEKTVPLQAPDWH